MGPFCFERVTIGIRCQDLLGRSVNEFGWTGWPQKFHFRQNIVDEAGLLKMNFLAMFTFFLMDVDSEEIFHGTFIFEKKILGQVFD